MVLFATGRPPTSAPTRDRMWPKRAFNSDGNQVEGFQVHLGGTLGLDAGFGRKVRGLKTTSEQVPVYIERVVRNFVSDRQPGERFATWALRADEELLV